MQVQLLLMLLLLLLARGWPGLQVSALGWGAVEDGAGGGIWITIGSGIHGLLVGWRLPRPRSGRERQGSAKGAASGTRRRGPRGSDQELRLPVWGRGAAINLGIGGGSREESSRYDGGQTRRLGPQSNRQACGRDVMTGVSRHRVANLSEQQTRWARARPTDQTDSRLDCLLGPLAGSRLRSPSQTSSQQGLRTVTASPAGQRCTGERLSIGRWQTRPTGRLPLVFRGFCGVSEWQAVHGWDTQVPGNVVGRWPEAGELGKRQGIGAKKKKDGLAGPPGLGLGCQEEGCKLGGVLVLVLRSAGGCVRSERGRVCVSRECHEPRGPNANCSGGKAGTSGSRREPRKRAIPDRACPAAAEWGLMQGSRFGCMHQGSTDRLVLFVSSSQFTTFLVWASIFALIFFLRICLIYKINRILLLSFIPRLSK